MEIKNIFRIMVLFVVLLISFIPVSFAVSISSSNPVLSVTLDKLHEVEVTVQKRMVASMDIPLDFDYDDQAIITLTKIKEDPAEQEFIQFLEYTYDSEEPTTIQLVPGKYVINGQYIVNKEVVIPGRRDTYCTTGDEPPEQIASDFTTAAAGVVAGAAVATVTGAAITGGLAAAGTALSSLGTIAGVSAALGPVGWIALGVMAAIALVMILVECPGEEIPVDYPEVPMNPAILGGVNGNITINDDLYSKDKINFYVFAIQDPLFIEDLNIIPLLEELGATYPEHIRPN